MAVYTNVSDSDLERFLAGFDLGAVTLFEGIAEGYENSNFRLETATGRYILTVFEHRTDAAALPWIMALLRHLEARGISCPLPVADSNGQDIGVLAGKPAAVVGFLEGSWPRQPTAEDCHLAGNALAELHLAGADYAVTRANPFGPAAWRAMFSDLRKDAARLRPDLDGRIASALDAIADVTSASDLPRGPIHADLFPDNMFFHGAGDGRCVSGVIDFYFACTDVLVYDLAIMLNAWCFDGAGRYDVGRGQALLDGYQRNRPLSAAECEALPLFGQAAAIRFLLTRLADVVAAAGDPDRFVKDPMEFMPILDFHSSVTSPADYGLSGGSR